MSNGYLDCMATITRTYMVDDLDGTTENDVSTVQFSIDKVSYEIDLSATNADRLRETLTRFVDAGTLVQPPKPARNGRAATPTSTRSRKTTPATSGRDQVRAVREWATQNGFEVSSRGRISKAIQDAFEGAH
jgi:hypothetical protein